MRAHIYNILMDKDKMAGFPTKSGPYQSLELNDKGKKKNPLFVGLGGSQPLVKKSY